VTNYDLIVADGTIVSPELGTVDADVGVLGERIAAIAEPGTLDGERTVDASGKHVLPGAIDPHTHYGFYRDLEDDAVSESRSALVSGVTTTGNMYRTPDPYLETVEDLVARCEEAYHNDFFLTLGPLSPTHVEELPALVRDYGITSFKWLQHYKGTVRERFGTDREMDDALGDAVMEALSGLDIPTTLGYHSENVEIRRPTKAELADSGRDSYEAFEESFPGYAEAQSMVAGAVIARQNDYDDSFYAVHISSRRTVEELRRLRESGYETIGETCPHYLILTAEECDDRMKVGPPIRHDEDRERLWEAVANGTIECIGTDHVANRLDQKVGDTIWESARAFPSNGALIPLLLTYGVEDGRLSLERTVEVTSTNNAKVWGLYPRKGTIRVGSDADLAIVDLDERRTVTPERLQSAADYSVYDGMELVGWPTHTVVRGTVAYDEGEITVDPGHGVHVERPPNGTVGD
jgi:dihydropyrimidinase